MMAHPEVAFRDCGDCRKWWYDEKTGEIHRKNGKKQKRPCPPPCETSAGCPKGHWKEPKSLNERNMMAYQHYRECRAVGSFPDDAVVRMNAGIIREVEDISDKKDNHLALMRAMTVASTVKGGSR